MPSPVISADGFQRRVLSYLGASFSDDASSLDPIGRRVLMVVSVLMRSAIIRQWRRLVVVPFSVSGHRRLAHQGPSEHVAN
jgi:hypothetical protein